MREAQLVPIGMPMIYLLINVPPYVSIYLCLIIFVGEKLEDTKQW
jgi:hypothetical protein